MDDWSTDDWRRPPPTRRQRRWDLAVGLLLAVLAVVAFELVRSIGLELEGGPGQVERSLWGLAVALPLCVRRSYPEVVLVLVSAVYIGLQARLLYEGIVTGIVLFLAFYTVGAWGRDRRVAAVARAVAVVAMFCWLGIALSTTVWGEVLVDDERTGLLPRVTAFLVQTLSFNVLFFGAAWVFGDLAWRRARDRAELVTRNAQLRVERDENARRAVLEERVRIARELHDVVAHHLSVMGLQAGAARHVLDSRPGATREALTVIEDSGRAAVTETRRIIGVLRGGERTLDVTGRDDAEAVGAVVDGSQASAAGAAVDGSRAGPADRTPLPGVADLADLVARTGRSGLQASFTEVGTPRDLPTALSVSMYRIAQEALTNTVRHARARRVDVRLRWLPDEVEIEVVDDGRGTGVASGTGLGLVGMRERAEMHGGLLDVGPRPVGGFRVRARFGAPAPQHRAGAVGERAGGGS